MVNKHFGWVAALFIIFWATTHQLSASAPTITSFSPTSGGIGTEVTITGTNFSTTPANNIVWFGAVRAEVSSATNTTLKTIVPVGVSHEPISVTVGGLTAYSTLPFNQTFKSSGSISFASEYFSISGYYDGTWHYYFYSDAGDLDGDGRIDLAAAGPYSPYNLYIHRNITASGSVTFDDAITKTLPNFRSQQVRIEDINGDGKKDIIVLSGDAETTIISVFPNTSASESISFGDRVDISISNGWYAKNMDIADFNLDGKPDIAVALDTYRTSFSTEDNYAILENTGSGGTVSFTVHNYKIRTDEWLGHESNDLATGDMDGDGKPDLVITGSDYIDSNNSTAGVYILRNTSTGGSLAFDTPAFLATSGRYGVNLMDSDMDGKLDLVTRSSKYFWVLRNTSTPGTISYASQVGYFEGNTYLDIKGVDFDGDHRTDIMTACDGLSWPFQSTSSGAGNIAFSRLDDVYSGYTVNPCDLNSDGKPDFFLGRSEGIYGKINTIGVPAFSASSSSPVLCAS